MQTNMITTLEESLTLASNQLLTGIVSFLPNIFGALLVVVIGLVLGDWLKSVVSRIVNLTKVSSLLKNPAITDFLKNAQVSHKIEDLLGEMVRWLVIVLFFVAGINILGITSVSLFLNTVISAIPAFISAIITLIIGVFVSGFLEKLVKGSLGSPDPSTSRFIGKIVSYAVMTFFVLAALSQLGIASFFINTVFIGFILSLSLALGIGLGLGSKDIIKTVLETWYKKTGK